MFWDKNSLNLSFILSSSSQLFNVTHIGESINVLFYEQSTVEDKRQNLINQY